MNMGERLSLCVWHLLCFLPMAAEGGGAWRSSSEGVLKLLKRSTHKDATVKTDQASNLGEPNRKTVFSG
jgi:hypothetical protein